LLFRLKEYEIEEKGREREKDGRRGRVEGEENTIFCRQQLCFSLLEHRLAYAVLWQTSNKKYY
jgi:hypothetical protein